MSELAQPLPDTFNWKVPDYAPVFERRMFQLNLLRSNPDMLAGAKEWYRTHPWDFINDWGVTFDPRNTALGIPARVPFVMFPRQVEFVEWLYWMWKNGQRGLCEKSRDCGATWLAVGFAVSMWLFEPGFVAGFGSRKEDLVDKRGEEKAIFHRIREFLGNLPVDFLPAGYDARTWQSHMRLSNPHTQSALIGEAGDQIGRGGRTSMYFVDEAAHVEHQQLVDTALSGNTNCQIDMSSVNTSGNEFYRKRMRLEKTPNLFIFDWHDDPRKDDAWYAKKQREFEGRPWIMAQEYDRDYNAAQEDSFIPGAWVVAAIDAHLRLGFEGNGLRVAGFDPADVGDAKAVVTRWGSVVTDAQLCPHGDITYAIPWAYNLADQMRCDVMRFDADGMGAPTMKLAFQHRAAGRMTIVPYNGSGAVEDPDKVYGITVTPENAAEHRNDRTNADMFLNFRAQSWTWLADRFKATYDAIQRANKGHAVNVDFDDLISIDSRCKDRHQLVAELSRPKRIFSKNGRIQVEAKSDMKKRQVDSPNLADALVMAMATKRVVPQKKILVARRQYLDKGAGF